MLYRTTFICNLTLFAIFLVGTPKPAYAEETEIPAPRVENHQYHELWLARQFESGVVNRLLTDYYGRYSLSESFSLLVGGSLSFIEQTGLSLIGVGGVFRIEKWKSEVGIGIQNERWASWVITENRFLGYWTFNPSEGLSLSLGYSYRAPQFKGLGFAESLTWPGDAAELGPLFRFQAHLFRIGELSASFLLWNYDRMRLYTWTNIHFSLFGVYNLKPNLKLQTLIGTAIEGFSGAIISWPQSTLSVGLRYEF